MIYVCRKYNRSCLPGQYIWLSKPLFGVQNRHRSLSYHKFHVCGGIFEAVRPKIESVKIRGLEVRVFPHLVSNQNQAYPVTKHAELDFRARICCCVGL